ncbi:MAG: hypothetical protein KDC61_23095 [Saprospiraceae bacterium]|nr:hypothetical protein [Saprospiraceae bacterium]MCB0577466.1 hypothetical protein [Saprospiraceae bacterium]MCB9356727.1 hypothetical protein [Lewinellaceae bacterium]
MKTIPLHFIAIRTILISLFLSVVSCQKASFHDAPFSDTTNSKFLFRSQVIETDVLAYGQWMIDYVMPLAEDEAVYSDLTSGFQHSALVTAKLISLGFADFNDFSQQLLAISSPVTTALNASEITVEEIEQILNQQIGLLDFSSLSDAPAEGIGMYLPCYEELMLNLTLAVAEIAVAAVAGPVAATVAGVIMVGYAYLSFKRCLKEQYPNGQ